MLPNKVPVFLSVCETFNGFPKSDIVVDQVSRVGRSLRTCAVDRVRERDRYEARAHTSSRGMQRDHHRS